MGMDALKQLQRELRAEAVDPYMGEVGVSVWDVSEGREIFSHEADKPRMMASTSKIFTIGAALAHLGPDYQAETRLWSDGEIDDQGVLRGDLYLEGGGDPSLGSAKHSEVFHYGVASTGSDVVDALQRAGVKEVSGAVVGDGSRFDTDARPTGRLGGLTYGRGKGEDVAQRAAESITSVLHEAGIATAGEATSGVVPQHADLLGTVQSPKLAELIRPAGKRSDNFISEMLTRQLAVEVRGERPGTTHTGAEVVVQYARDRGSDIHQVDGSGLAFRNQVAPVSAVNFLQEMVDQPFAAEFSDSLALMGVDGTLDDRGRNTSVHGAVKAKTGTHLVRGSTAKVREFRCSALTGICPGPQGRTLLFSIMQENPKSRYTALAAQERMVRSMMDYAQSS